MAKLKFICEFEVDETWVADGFNPDDEDAHSMIAHRLPHATGGEIKGRVLVPIDQEKAAKIMGYLSLRAMNAARKKDGDAPIRAKGTRLDVEHIHPTYKPPAGKKCKCKRRTHETTCPLAE